MTSPDQILLNLAGYVKGITTPNPPTRGWNRKRPNKTYAATKDEIATAARQLAVAVHDYLAGRLEPLPDSDIPF